MARDGSGELQIAQAEATGIVSTTDRGDVLVERVPPAGGRVVLDVQPGQRITFTVPMEGVTTRAEGDGVVVVFPDGGEVFLDKVGFLGREEAAESTLTAAQGAEGAPSIIIEMGAGVEVNLNDLDLEGSTMFELGEDLLVVLSSGQSLLLVDFFPVAQGENPAMLVLAGGQTIPAPELLNAEGATLAGEVSTAAGGDGAPQAADAVLAGALASPTINPVGNTVVNPVIYAIDTGYPPPVFVHYLVGSEPGGQRIEDEPGGTPDTPIVVAVNNPPVAVNDAFSTNANAVLTVNALNQIMGNDSDPDGDAINVRGVNGSQAAIGAQITLNAGTTPTLLTQQSNGTFVFDPNGQYTSLGVGDTATVQYQYTITDPGGLTAIATVTITINGVNDGPDAVNDAYTTDQNTVLNVAASGTLGNDTDPDTGTTLTVTHMNGATGNLAAATTLATTAAGTRANDGIVTQNANGSLTFNPNGQFNYLGTGQSANVSYTYQISDGDGGSDTATVTITVTGVNDAPTASPDTNTTNEDTAVSRSTAGTGVLSNDSDVDTGTTLTVTQVTDGTSTATAGNTLTSTTGATLVLNANGTYTYNPTGSATMQALRGATDPGGAQQQATETFTYTASDGQGGTVTQTLTITVTGVNDAPVLDNTPTHSLSAIAEDSVAANVAVYAVRDATGLAPGVTVAAGDKLVGSAAAITDVDNASVEGIAVTFATTSVYITADNATRPAGTWQFSTNGGTSWSTLAAAPGADVSGNSAGSPLSDTNAVLLNPTALIRFVPNENFYGTVELRWRAWDQTSGTNGQTGVNVSTNGGTTAFSTAVESATITINPLNDVPVLDNTGTPSLSAINEDVAAAANAGTSITNIIASSVSDADRLYATTTVPSGLAITAVDTTNGTWQFTTDGGSNWTTFGALSNTSATLLASNANTFVRFLPNANYNGTADITYRAWDQSNLGQLSGIVTIANGAVGVNVSTGGGTTAYSLLQESAQISVNAVNDAPVLATNAGLQIPNAGTKTITNTILNVTDVDNTSAQVTYTLTSVPANGTLKKSGVALGIGGTFTQADVNANAITFEHTNGGGNGSFTFTVSDGQGGTIGATTANITVNNAPTAVADAASVGVNTTQLINVLGNDSDPENDSLTVTITTAPGAGTATVVGNQIQYVSTGATGNQTIGYTITDAAGNTSTANLTVSVRSPVSLANIAAGTSTDGFAIRGGAANRQAGWSVGGGGDVDGDGLDDVIVSSSTGTGTVALVYGKTTNTAVTMPTTFGTFTGGVAWAHSGASARAGYSVDMVGDFNNDGLSDFIAGAPQGGGSGAGAIVTGQTGSNLNTAFVGVYGGVAFVGTASAAGGAGTAVSGLGDINGDGLADAIVATPATNRADIVLGQTTSANLGNIAANGSVIHLTNVTSSITSPHQANQSVGAAGDFNNDGFADVLLGQALASVNNAATDTAYVVFGKASMTDLNLNGGPGVNGITITGPSGSRLGVSVETAGDVNGDGISDIVLGMPTYNPGSSVDAGGAVVIFGQTGITGTINASSAATLGTNGFFIVGGAAGDQAGLSVSGAGDVNGDGYDDMIIGAWTADPSGTSNAGTAYIVYGGASLAGSTVNLSSIAGGVGGYAIRGVAANDQTGIAVSRAGDVNGDGYADIIVGANQHDSNGSDSGSAFVVFGGIYETQVTHQGTGGADTLTGTSGANQMIGGAGADTLIGGGGADYLAGGAGDDTLRVSSTSFLRVDGGTGSDTLKLDGASLHLNLTTKGSEAVRGIETIDLGSVGGATDGSNQLTLTLQDLFQLSGTSNTLTVLGENSDKVNITMTGATVSVNTPAGYTTYTSGLATLVVQNTVDQTGITTT
ncbi:MAG: beta strand repeat-containing protein [Alphaproteobacteria bacterium]